MLDLKRQYEPLHEELMNVIGAVLKRQQFILGEPVAEFERATLLAELERSGGHVTNAAKALGLERSHFYKKCQQLGIDLKAERA